MEERWVPNLNGYSSGYNSQDISPARMGLILPAHSSALGPATTSGGGEQLFLYGLPSGLSMHAIQDAILTVLRTSGKPIIDHLGSLDISCALGTCLLNFDRPAWAAAALHFLSSADGLKVLKSILGGIELDITYNSPENRYYNDYGDQKVCEGVLKPVPTDANEWDIFKRLMFEPACNIVPTRVRIEKNKARVSFMRREHLIFAVFRLSRDPVLIDGVEAQLHWIESVAQINDGSTGKADELL
ncbi:hypothetical protein BIW11_05457 [Tropilaelaps mercedesae]|uniref:Uncharacterized protein n=1 Tax=Tropilaelaps mercedesae TaxID=418985 RepID=A0A1V9Y266_9ACAR|nr:hypothetical protein BIW11_05457 [Tropilaelaps mercedesae]